jgi:protocatechuate 3,4-dioxygenase beta subunit
MRCRDSKRRVGYSGLLYVGLLLGVSTCTPQAVPSPKGASSTLLVTASGLHGDSEARVQVRPLVSEHVGPVMSGSPVAEQKLEDGEAEFSELVPGTYEVRVVMPGKADVFGEATLPAMACEVHVCVPVSRGRFALTGAASWRDGTPFPGWIGLACPFGYVGSLSTSAGVMWTACDSKGTFRFASLAAGGYRLLAYSARGEFASISDGALTLPVGGPIQLVVDSGGLHVQGRVTRHSDRSAISGAKVRLFDVGGDEWPKATAITGKNGRFDIRLPALGHAEILVEAHGCSSKVVPVSARMADQDLAIDLDQAGAMKGTVLDARSGEPVAGAMVHAVWDQLGASCALIRSVRTDAQGRYMFSSLIAGPVRTFVLGGGWISGRLAPWSGARAGIREKDVLPSRVTQVDLVAVRSATARLSVASGDPPYPARVVVQPDLGSALGSDAWAILPDLARMDAIVARSGQLLIPDLIPNVKYAGVVYGEQSGVRFEDTAPSSGRVAVWSAQAPSQASVCHFQRAQGLRGVSITGKVAGPAPLRGAVARVEAFARPAEPPCMLLPASATVLVPVGQEFRLSGLDPGMSYGVRVSLDWRGVRYVAESTVRAPGTAGKLQLRTGPSRILSAAVQVDSDGGALVSRAAAWVHRHEQDVVRPSEMGLRTDVHAGLLSVPVPSRRELMWIEIARVRDGMGRNVALGGAVFGPFPPGGIPTRLRLPPGRVVHGRVVDSRGNPVSGARVLALPLRPVEEREAGIFVGNVHASDTSDSSGEFTLTGLGGGDYQLWVPRIAGLASSGLVPLSGSEAGPTRITLCDAKVANVDVADQNGVPIPGARVELRWKERDGRDCLYSPRPCRCLPWQLALLIRRSWTTDERGRVSIRGLHPRRRYTVIVYPPADRRDVQAMRMPNWLAHDSSIVLR